MTNQRRQVVVDQKLQFHYFWLWVLVATGVVAVIAIVGLSKATEWLRMDKMVADTLRSVFWVTGAYILILSIVFGSYTVFHLHRVTGPVYRLNRCVDAMRRGELSQTISLRQKDYFQDLAANLDALRSHMAVQRRDLSVLQSKLEAAGQAEASGEIARILAAASDGSKERESRPGL